MPLLDNTLFGVVGAPSATTGDEELSELLKRLHQLSNVEPAEAMSILPGMTMQLDKGEQRMRAMTPPMPTSNVAAKADNQAAAAQNPQTVAPSADSRFLESTTQASTGAPKRYQQFVPFDTQLEETRAQDMTPPAMVSSARPTYGPNGQRQPVQVAQASTGTMNDAGLNFLQRFGQGMARFGDALTGQAPATTLAQMPEQQESMFQALTDAGVDARMARAAVLNPKLLDQLIATKFGAKALGTWTEIGQDRFGNKLYGFVNAQTGKVTPYQPQGGSAIAAAGDTSLSGEEYLKTLPPEDARMIKGLVEGRIKPPPMGRKNPYWEQLIQKASVYDPNFDMTKFASRQALRKSFEAGRDADEIKAYNTVMGHMIDAYKDVEAMGNTRSSWLNLPYNMIRGQTSEEFQKAKADLISKLDIAIGEVNRAASGKPITVTERQYWHEQLSENSSPETLKQTLASFTQLMLSRLNASAVKWNDGFGYKEGDPGYKTGESLLSPKAKAQYDFLIKGEGARPAGHDTEGETGGKSPTGQKDFSRGMPKGRAKGTVLPNPHFDPTRPEGPDNPRQLIEDGE